MEIRDMQMADIEARSAELETALNAENADIESITAEVTALEERKAQIVAEAEERKAQLEAVEKTAKEVQELKKEEERNMMDIKEYRNTKEYIDAFAEYVKTGNDAECRALLTENVGTGTVVVPEFVETKVMTAWENDEIMNRVRKTFIKGNLKVNFEISGTDAVVHTEGGNAVAEETLTLGMVTIVPFNVKKWISISDEVYAMGGEAFLDYIYDELAYRIVKALAANVLQRIMDAAYGEGTSPEAPQAVYTGTLVAGTIVAAEALLSAEATDVVAIMNRSTWGQLKALQVTSGNNVGDVFDGLPVIFSDALPAYSATVDEPYMIVGDLKGVTVNFPEGDDIKYKFDEHTEMTSDLIRVLGKVYAGIAATAPYRFTVVERTNG